MSTTEGSAGRVAIAQRQARRTFALAGVYAVATVGSLVLPHRTGAWLPLHLFLVGVLLLAISASTQFFAVTWAAGPPPPTAVAATQRWLLAGGVALLAAARELEWPTAFAAIGGVAVIAALLVLAASLHRIVTAGVQRRFDAALHAYLAALSAGFCGAALGVVMVTGGWGSVLARVRAAHLSLNLLGLIGLVIVGTLPFFVATQGRVKMSRRADPRAQSLVLAGLVAALVGSTVGFLAGYDAVAAAGLVAYAGGIVGVVALLPALGAKQLRWAGPRLLQLGAGLGWWIAATLAVARQASGGGAVFTRGGGAVFTPTVVSVLVIGGYAQILLGSLAYLGPVLRGGGHERLAAGFRTTRSWPGLVAANVAAVAAVFGAGLVVGLAIGLWVFDSAVRAVVLLQPPKVSPAS
ncbi:MAG TPA: hypothetical protein VFF40_04660 [Acidimicrobiia bacterium]|nr:hypothetical protein [Acidimicrobiia bacterium]